MKKTFALLIAIVAALSALASEQTVGTTNVVVDVPSRAIIVSCQMRPTDPTIMDVVYKVESPAEKVKVRALAFKDGKRDFEHVLRPETFLDGTEANLGDDIAANVEHKLSWNAAADWDATIGKVSFEVLSMANTTNSFVLPYMYRDEIRWGQREYYIFTPQICMYHDGDYNDPDIEYDLQWKNVLFWFYADRDKDLSLEEGRLYWNDSALLCDEYSFTSPYSWYDSISVWTDASDCNMNKFIKAKFKSFMNVNWHISPNVIHIQTGGVL